MIFKFIFPILAGLSIVFQGTLNRHIATQVGLVSAVFLNALVFLIFSGILWTLVRYGVLSGVPILSAKPFTGLELLDLIPGIFGFLIVFCTPMAISYLGAPVTFATIICTQLLGSMAIEYYTTKQVPNMSSLLGVIVMLVGLFLLMNGKK